MNKDGKCISLFIYFSHLFETIPKNILFKMSKILCNKFILNDRSKVLTQLNFERANKDVQVRHIVGDYYMMCNKDYLIKIFIL